MLCRITPLAPAEDFGGLCSDCGPRHVVYCCDCGLDGGATLTAVCSDRLTAVVWRRGRGIAASGRGGNGGKRAALARPCLSVAPLLWPTWCRTELMRELNAAGTGRRRTEPGPG